MKTEIEKVIDKSSCLSIKVLPRSSHLVMFSLFSFCMDDGFGKSRCCGQIIVFEFCGFPQRNPLSEIFKQFSVSILRETVQDVSVVLYVKQK